MRRAVRERKDIEVGSVGTEVESGAKVVVVGEVH